MEHLERIKAMEVGLAPPPSGLDWPTAAVCIAMGAGVPVGSFAITWLATLTDETSGGIWVAPVFVSIPAIIAARKLAIRAFEPRPGAGKPDYVPSSPAGKPAFDPEAFDVVGRRG